MSSLSLQTAPSLTELLNTLTKYPRVLFLTTSNRWGGEKGGELPKSTWLAYELQRHLEPGQATVIEVPKLVIHPCEGNVSTARGNTCGEQKAILADNAKNPSGWHRCWASVNNADDELWRVSAALFAADAVIFFGSVRWGQANSIYQKLIERLTWIENRQSTLGESNIVAKIAAGAIFVGHNWRGAEVLATQQAVLRYFGFAVQPNLCWQWQYVQDPADETPFSYAQAASAFTQTVTSQLGSA